MIGDSTAKEKDDLAFGPLDDLIVVRLGEDPQAVYADLLDKALDVLESSDPDTWHSLVERLEQRLPNSHLLYGKRPIPKNGN